MPTALVYPNLEDAHHAVKAAPPDLMAGIAINGWSASDCCFGSVIPLACGGIVRYWTEKIAIEAEAQGSEAGYPIYRRPSTKSSRQQLLNRQYLT